MKSDELRAEARRLRDSGLTYKQIGQRINRALSTVYYYCSDIEPERVQQRGRDRRSLNRQYIAKIKQDSICADCKEDYLPHILQFDHVRGEKLGDISTLVKTSSLEVVKEEIDKCEVVCANCHAERTYSRLVKNGDCASSHIGR